MHTKKTISAPPSLPLFREAITLTSGNLGPRIFAGENSLCRSQDIRPVVYGHFLAFDACFEPASLFTSEQYGS